MNTQTISHAHSADLRPWNLIEWQNSSSGTQWERFRDSGSDSAARNFGDSPFRTWRWSIVAALLLLTMAALWFVVSPWRLPAQIATAAGEQRQLTLADGTVLDLKANSRARIALNSKERRVILARGEARLAVAHEAARPFLLSTPQATFETIDAVFQVHAGKDATAVRVLGGSAIILPPLIDEVSGAAYSPPRLLSAGELALVTSEGEVEIRR